MRCVQIKSSGFNTLIWLRLALTVLSLSLSLSLSVRVSYDIAPALKGHIHDGDTFSLPFPIGLNHDLPLPSKGRPIMDAWTLTLTKQLCPCQLECPRQKRRRSQSPQSPSSGPRIRLSSLTLCWTTPLQWPHYMSLDSHHCVEYHLLVIVILCVSFLLLQ